MWPGPGSLIFVTFIVDICARFGCLLHHTFQFEFEGRVHHCKRLLLQQAFIVHRAGKLLVPIIDDAQHMPPDCLRKLRLLCEDSPLPKGLSSVCAVHFGIRNSQPCNSQRHDQSQPDGRHTAAEK